MRLRRRAGFSIIELLIALVIISILVAMVILVASQRAAEARLRAAQADLRMIAEAEQQASIDIGYFMRLYVLDDVLGGDGISPAIPNNTADVIDGLQDESGNTRNLDGATYGIVPDFGSIPTNTSSTGQQGALRDITALTRNETLIGIGLPYITYQRIYINPTTGQSYGVPRDPWGNPYVIITRQGFINDIDTLFSGSSAGTSPAQLTTVNMTGGPSGLNGLIFDRFTAVSFGPNALPGDGSGVAPNGDFGADDDLRVQLN
jgi:prepilin-type N-terminal cleavage/methylation domain-containing protein